MPERFHNALLEQMIELTTSALVCGAMSVTRKSELTDELVHPRPAPPTHAGRLGLCWEPGTRDCNLPLAEERRAQDRAGPISRPQVRRSAGLKPHRLDPAWHSRARHSSLITYH